MDVKKAIGENIRYERQRRNMSLEDLAEIIGITPGFLGLVERGHRGTDIVKLLKICEVFNITMDYLAKKQGSGGLKVAERGYDEVETKRDTVQSLLHDLNEQELEFCISVIKNLKEMKYNK